MCRLKTPNPDFVILQHLGLRRLPAHASILLVIGNVPNRNIGSAKSFDFSKSSGDVGTFVYKKTR